MTEQTKGSPAGADHSTKRELLEPRVCIVAEHASAKFGGEAFLPLHYFRLLRTRGVEAWLVCHERVRDELTELLPDQVHRMHFVTQDAAQRALWTLGQRLSADIHGVTAGALMHLRTQIRQRALVRKLVQAHHINVVHEPIPVSPTQPSALWRVGAPVVIGPMNGGMRYPPAFRKRQHRADLLALTGARALASFANLVIPGKRSAQRLLVANARTRAALPRVIQHVTTEELVENGVDFQRFQPRTRRQDSTLRAAFVGRLVDWKALDVLLASLRQARRSCDVTLEVFGDGPMRSTWERLAADLDLEHSVKFHGFVPQNQVAEQLRELDVLVLPSVYECGGAVVLEAMALGLPVVATRWGGPADYLDENTGILVDPESVDQMQHGFARALERLALDPGLAARMGQAGRAKATEYDWDRKIDRILAVYQSVIAEYALGAKS